MCPSLAPAGAHAGMLCRSRAIIITISCSGCYSVPCCAGAVAWQPLGSLCRFATRDLITVSQSESVFSSLPYADDPRPSAYHHTPTPSARHSVLMSFCLSGARLPGLFHASTRTASYCLPYCLQWKYVSISHRFLRATAVPAGTAESAY